MVYVLNFVAETLRQAIFAIFHLLTGSSFQEQTKTEVLEARDMKNIVILGASYSGISTAHRILKQNAKKGNIKVTLVSPNSHLYWNVAAVRGLIPGQFTDEQLFQPIATGFKQYPASQFEFVLAKAQSLDVEAKKVSITGSSDDRILEYDFLVLATGSRVVGDLPLKGLDSTESTKAALHDLQMRVEKSKTVVIAGAGATGVEIAGELGYQYRKQKRIILVASGARVLEQSPDFVSKIAVKELQNLGVEIKLEARVINSTISQNGQQELTLSNGEKLVTDLYLPTFGLIPNTSYVPQKFLTSDGFVEVDEFLKVKGTEDVWAIGDVSDLERSQWMATATQSAHLTKNITLILNNKAPLPYKAVPKSPGRMGLQIGKKTGVGHWGTTKIPGFMVAYLRKSLFLERLGSTVDGSAF